VKDVVTKNALQVHITDSCLQNYTVRSIDGSKTAG